MFKNRERGQAAWYLLAVLFVIVVIFALCSLRVVDQNKSCAWIRFGKMIGEARPGLQMVNPFNHKVCYPKQSVLFQTAADVTGDGRVDSQADYYDFPVEVKTNDGQSAMVEFNLKFHVEPSCTVTIWENVASNTEDLVIRVVNNFSRSLPRDIAPQYDAVQLYGPERTLFEAQIREELIPLFTDNCVVLDEFILRDINFDPEYENTMEQKQIAMEGITVQKYLADQAVENARATVTNARAQADAQIETARGSAETVRLMAIAEAESIRIRGEALKNNPAMLSALYFDALKTANWMMVPWDSMQGFVPVQP